MAPKTQKHKLAPVLVSTALTTSCLTLIVSVVYLGLSIAGLVFRFACDAASPDSVGGSDYLMNVLHRLYIVDEECNHFMAVGDVSLTKPDTVLIFLSLILIMSVLSIGAAVGLLTVIYKEDLAEHILPTVYTYVAIYACVLALDVIIGTFFGIDFSNISDIMDLNSGGFSINYARDMQRLSAAFLMSMALKGFMYHFVNFSLVVLLLVYAGQYQLETKNPHSIHTLGAINGYEQPRARQDDGWQSQTEIYGGLAKRSQHLNPAYVNDEDFHPHSPRSHRQEPSVSDYSSRYFDRSESWQARSAQSGSRPFSYLGDNNRSPTYLNDTNRSPSYLNDTNRSPSYLNENNRPAAARPPPVPAPDYSPPTGRRLKSALKPAYQY